MKLEKIIPILRASAKSYQKNLENKNFLIVYQNKERIEYIQVKFSAENFLHLTGIKLKKGQSKKLFYKVCLNGKIAKEEIGIKEDGTTKLKLNILEMMTNICKTAKMIGKYNNWGDKLYTEFIIGTNYMAMGFIKIGGEFYVPNTALNKSVTDITYQTYRIIAIFSKKVNEAQYNEICFCRRYNHIVNQEVLNMLDDIIKKNLG